MSQDQIVKRWRDYLVTKLQDRYGLTQKQAETKANTWLLWIKRRQPRNLAAAGRDQRRAARLDSTAVPEMASQNAIAPNLRAFLTTLK